MKNAKKVLPVLLNAALVGAFLLLAFSVRDSSQPGALALLQTIQSPEAATVSPQGAPCALRQVGFDPKEPRARCLNHAFFQAGGPEASEPARLWAETSVSFAGDPESVEGVRLSYHASFLIRHDGFFLSPGPFPKPLTIERTIYRRVDIEHAVSAPPQFRSQPVFSLSQQQLKGGRVAGACCWVFATIRCKDGGTYSPKAQACFAVDLDS